MKDEYMFLALIVLGTIFVITCITFYLICLTNLFFCLG
jgi:hypothetical protein